MKREIIFSMPSPFRDTFRIPAYRFGQGAKALAIVGALRGDEIRQQYSAARLVSLLDRFEAEGRLAKDNEILVIPSANPFSMNIEKRFWALDGTDINRMFPGYDRGETTQRIAAALFEALQGYKYGVQLASFYLPGDFIPHVRILETGYENSKAAKLFGLPYIHIRHPRPFDTTLLNYNWQIWETSAFSLYGGANGNISQEENGADNLVAAVLRFMTGAGLLTGKKERPGGRIVHDDDLVSVKAHCAGFYIPCKRVKQTVAAGDALARIVDPYEGKELEVVSAPCRGTLFFAHARALCIEHTILFKLL